MDLPQSLQNLQDLADLEDFGEPVVWPDGLDRASASALIANALSEHATGIIPPVYHVDGPSSTLVPVQDSLSSSSSHPDISGLSVLDDPDLYCEEDSDV